MTISEADHDVGCLLADVKCQQVADLEALRRRCVQQLLQARQWCEEVNALHAGSGSGQGAGVHADQKHAQWLLCAAVKDIEDVDALLNQIRQ